MPEIAVPLTQSFLQPGGAVFGERVTGLKNVLGAVLSTLRDPRKDSANDPVRRTRKNLLSDSARLQDLENNIEQEINNLFESALEEVSS